MEKTIQKRFLACTAALTVVAGSAVSCSSKSGKGDEKSKTAQELMAAAYKATELETDIDLTYINDLESLSDGRYFISGFNERKNSTVFYIGDSEFVDFQEIVPEVEKGSQEGMSGKKEPLPVKEDDEEAGAEEKDNEKSDEAKDEEKSDEEKDNEKSDETSDEEKSGEKKDEEKDDNVHARDVRYQFALSPDEKIMAVATVTEYDGMTPPDYGDENFDYQNYDYDALEKATTRTYKLVTFDLDGKKLSENDIKELNELDSDSEYGVSIGNISPIGGGKTVISIYNDGPTSYTLLNEDGSFGPELDLGDDTYISSFSCIGDNECVASGYFNNDSAIAYIDPDNMTIKGDVIKITNMGNNNINQIYEGSGDYKFSFTNEKGFYGLKEDGTAEEIINWMDSDMGNGNASGVVSLENGDFIVAYYSYDGEGSCQLYRLSKRDASELENLKVVTIGVLYDNWSVKQRISVLNRKNTDVRYKMVDYSIYDDYDEKTEKYNNSAEQQLKKDIVSGKAPDMIVTYSNGMVKSLQNKGLFADLYQFLDKDPDLSRDDIMPNVLKACETKGQLTSIAPSFTVSTIAAKSKFIKDQGWTIDEMIKAYDDMPDGMRFSVYNYKENILGMIMYYISSAIDYEKGTCNFDTPEFRSLLEFCNRFPSSEDEIDWEDSKAVNEMYSDDNIWKDKVLTSDMYIYDFQEYTRQIKGAFNEPVTLVGYPMDGEGNGGLLNFSENYAILSNASDKDACWNFIKEMFTGTDDEENSKYGMGGLSSLVSKFDAQAEASMKKPVYKDEEGNEREEDLYYYGMNGDNIKIDPLTKEEKDYIVDYIKSIDRCYGDFDPEVSEIFNEEVMAFLKGEKSCDEIVDLLQNRISLLVSEQS